MDEPNVPDATHGKPEVDHDEITKRNSGESPLLKLPAELRLKIYRFALEPVALNLQYLKASDKVFLERSSQEALQRNVAVTTVSRQVHAETSLFFFTLRSYRAVPAVFFKWALALTREQRKSIRHVFLHTKNQRSFSILEV